MYEQWKSEGKPTGWRNVNSCHCVAEAIAAKLQKESSDEVLADARTVQEMLNKHHNDYSVDLNNAIRDNS